MQQKPRIRTIHPDEIQTTAELHRLNDKYPNAFKLHGTSGSKRIALTFDDGPDHGSEAILAVLDKYQVKGTFFVEGRKFEQNIEQVKKAYQAGHIFGGHSFNHKNLTELTDQAFWSQEIQATQHIFEKNLGYQPALFRPPFGEITESQIEMLIEAGITNIIWSVDPRDWDSSNNSVSTLTSMVVDNLHSEAIILFHDGGGESRENSAAALLEIIPHCLKLGYEFVTIDTLLGIDYKIVNAPKYGDR